MATETGTAEGFGRVSRTVGTVFRYVLLAATLAGIVTLGILLVYVLYDAIEPFSADPGWYAVWFATLVFPTLALGAYLSRRTSRGLERVGLNALGLPVVGTLFGAGASTLFVDVIPTLLWLGYVVAVAVPVVAIVALERTRLSFVSKLLAALAISAGSLLFLPGFVTSLPVVPTDWMVIAITFGAPLALLGRWYFGARWTDRAGNVAGGLALLAVLLGGPIGGIVGTGPIPGVLLVVGAVVPTGMYAAVVAREDVENRAGLLLPVVLIGGVVAAIVVSDVLGFAGPNSHLDWQLLTSTTVTDPETAGMYPAIIGSIMLMVIVALAAFPVGVGAAVYLEEYAPDSRFTRLIQINISNLAGVPSVVYGLLGLGVFIRYVGAEPGTVLVGGLTLGLLILPIVVISAQEALRSVPDDLRQASYGMGATRWQTIKEVVLPEAFPGILTGTILALGRAIGETAPLLVVGAPSVATIPTDLGARISAMPLQIYVWASTFASPEFYNEVVPAGVIVLLAVMLALNSVAIVLRNRYQRGS